MCIICVSDISVDETKLNSHRICKCFRASDETHSRYSDTLRLQLVMKLPCVRFNSYSNTVIYWSTYWFGLASPTHRHSKYLHMYYKSEEISSPYYNACYNEYLYIKMTSPHVQFISYPLPLADLWALPELGPALWLLFWRTLRVAKWQLRLLLRTLQVNSFILWHVTVSKYMWCILDTPLLAHDRE